MSGKQYDPADCKENRREIYAQLNQDRGTLREIKGGINAMKWIIPIVVVVIGALVAFIYNAGNAEIHRRLDDIAKHFSVHETTATINEPEINTP
jgi:hypothetical protein